MTFSTTNDILNDHDLRLAESLADDISDQAKIHRMIFENEVTRLLLKAHRAEQQPEVQTDYPLDPREVEFT